MLILLILVEAAALKITQSPPQAVATVRIHRPGQANAQEWHRRPPSERREIRRIDEQGRPLLIRVIDYQ